MSPFLSLSCTCLTLMLLYSSCVQLQPHPGMCPWVLRGPNKRGSVSRQRWAKMETNAYKGIGKPRYLWKHAILFVCAREYMVHNLYLRSFSLSFGVRSRAKRGLRSLSAICLSMSICECLPVCLSVCLEGEGEQSVSATTGGGDLISSRMQVWSNSQLASMVLSKASVWLVTSRSNEQGKFYVGPNH